MARTGPRETALAPWQGPAAAPTHANMLVAKGLLALCPSPLQEHWLNDALARPCSTAPVLGGPVHPQNPATVAL